MNYEITGLSEPQPDKHGNIHVRVYTPSLWSTNDEGNIIYEEGKTIFCYDESFFPNLEIGKTITP
tara:strand:- start:566 stop:760 length:195 start_codon:yes stop_codon:yes gene_type:complete